MENNHRISSSNNAGVINEKLLFEKEIRKQILINKLNHINFQDDTISVTFKHAKRHHTVSLRAKPEPCLGNELVCKWVDEDIEKLHRLSIYNYKFHEIHIANGKNILRVRPDDYYIDRKGINLLLPDFCVEVSSRKINRYRSKEINAQLIQNSASFLGRLKDFSAVSFRLEILSTPQQSFSWINPDSKVTLILYYHNEMIYSGECTILQCAEGQGKWDFVLKPIGVQIRRFKTKDFRAKRQELVPSPYVSFKHPFTQKPITLRIIDLSGSGFSLEESRENAALIPGMIIPEMSVYFSTSFKTQCKAQVIYTTRQEEITSDLVKCGVAILDMEVEEHSKLLAVLHQAEDDNSLLCSDVDLDELWRFFFDSGFIYPNKYKFIEENKKRIKEIFEKLYSRPPELARHFIYKDKGRILGHMAMIRFYNNSWLIHHHAADIHASGTAGFKVLNQISRYINEAHSILSVRMGSVFCYYRPENKFPNRIFGGVANSAKNPKRCSLDTFSYFHFSKLEDGEIPLEKPWYLEKIQAEDLDELEAFYESISGGLMLKALELKKEFLNLDHFVSEYHQLGFKREKLIYALKNDNNVKAIMLVNISDIGINLSDLTSSIHIFVLDPDNLPSEILKAANSELSKKFEQKEIPILLYPVSYADTQSIPYEKRYTLWVLHAQHLDDYFRFLERYFRRLGSFRVNVNKEKNVYKIKDD